MFDLVKKLTIFFLIIAMPVILHASERKFNLGKIFKPTLGVTPKKTTDDLSIIS